MGKTVVWWIRRDLRLADNQALNAALANGDAVLPLFILDQNLLASPHVGSKRLSFLYGGLNELDQALRRRGSRLVLGQGRPVEQLAKFVAETDASLIIAERDFSPYALRRDGAISQSLPLQLVDGLTIHLPDAILKANGLPYTVYTPFRRRWTDLPLPGKDSLLPAPKSIPTPGDVESLRLLTVPVFSNPVLFPPGEAEAKRRLAAFINGGDGPFIANYADSRDRLDHNGTSLLSPYIRFGMVSVKEVVIAASDRLAAASHERDRRGPYAWLNELVWREFFIAILYHFPHVYEGNFRPVYDSLKWQNDPDHFAAWCAGETGYPVIDAAMRQLRATGWMHNRARMISASFLVKHLLTDWRWGERWFMQHLLDGEPAANNGGWQWVAGTGTDAAPYFRIFNPVLQGKKYDPDGEFVRSWLPELTDVPRKYIHEPWLMPVSVQEESSCRIGQNYPAPIVDHAVAREKALAAYAEAKG